MLSAGRIDSGPPCPPLAIVTSRRKFGVHDLNSVGMKRPVGQTLQPAKTLLRQLGGVELVVGVDFHAALADFRLPSMFAEHVFHKSNHVPWHDTLLCRSGPLSSAIAIRLIETIILDADQADRSSRRGAAAATGLRLAIT